MKRALCFILAIFLLFSFSGCTTMIITTIEEYEETFGGENKTAQNSTPTTHSVNVYKDPSLPVAVTHPIKSTKCFDVLDKKQQEIYKSISAAAENVISEHIPLDNKPSREDVYIAFWAVVRDHPEYFWLADQIGYVNRDGKVYFYLVFCMDEDKISLNKIAFNEKLRSIEGSIRGETDYQMVLSIHAFLCESVDYNYRPMEYSIYTAWGVFMNGSAVCQGYAEAMMILCNRFGIECTLISGKDKNGQAHMWNQVKMGGKWYNIDTTFDDANNQNYHTYFGLSNTLIKADHTFSPLLNREKIDDYTNNYFNFVIADCYSDDCNFLTRSNRILSEDISESKKIIVTTAVNDLINGRYGVDFGFDYFPETLNGTFVEKTYKINQCVKEINENLKKHNKSEVKLKSYIFVGNSVRLVFEKK